MGLRFSSLRPSVRIGLVVLLAAGILLGLYALAGGQGVPWLLRRALADWQRQHQGVAVDVDRIRCDPFTATLTLEDLTVAAKGGSTPLRVAQVSVDAAAWTSLRQGRLTFADIRVTQPEFSLSADSTGLLAAFAAGSEEPSTLAVEIGRLSIENGKFRYAAGNNDAIPELHWEGMALTLERYASDGQEPARLTLAAHGEGDERLDIELELTPNPHRVEGKLHWKQLALTPFWQRYLHLPGLHMAAGKASLETPFSHDDTKGFSLGPGKLQLNGLKLVDNDQTTPVLQVPAATASDVSLATAKKHLHIGGIVISQPNGVAWLTAGGKLSVNHYRPPDAPRNNDGGSTWSYSIDRVEVRDGEINLADRSRPDGAKVTVSGLALSLAPLGTGNKPFTLDMQGSVDDQGHLRLHTGDGGAHAEFALENIQLPPYQPYLAEFARLRLEHGALNLAGTVAVQSGDKMAVEFAGQGSIDDLNLSHLDEEIELLTWRRLAVNDIRLGYPFAGVQIAGVVAERPYAYVTVEPDQALNWTKLFHLKDAGNGAQHGTSPQFSIGTLRIRKGTLEFSDQSLKPEFNTAVHEMEGAVKDLATGPGSHTILLLEGKVEQHSPVRLQGSLTPTRAGTDADVELRFTNLDLSRLSPYSGKFAGYRIDNGKMSVELHYRVKNRKLDVENVIVMDHLTLGEKVDSKSATTLPIGLAIALLRDSGGKIDLHLPISGNLNDPRFSLRNLYANAITSLVTKLVTSPFAVLGSLLEGEPEEYGRVSFAPGEAVLSSYEMDKLGKLAAALRQRSGLTLEIRGVAVPERDRTALAQAQLQRHIRRLWQNGLRTAGATVPPEVDGTPIPEKDYQRLLFAEYQESGYGETDDMHRARTALLAGKFAADDSRLRQLAEDRAARIRDFLIQEGSVTAQRIFLLDAQPNLDAKEEIKAVLMLNGS